MSLIYLPESSSDSSKQFCHRIKSQRGRLKMARKRIKNTKGKSFCFSQNNLWPLSNCLDQTLIALSPALTSSIGVLSELCAMGGVTHFEQWNCSEQKIQTEFVSTWKDHDRHKKSTLSGSCAIYRDKHAKGALRSQLLRRTIVLPQYMGLLWGEGPQDWPNPRVVSTRVQRTLLSQDWVPKLGVHLAWVWDYKYFNAIPHQKIKAKIGGGGVFTSVQLIHGWIRYLFVLLTSLTVGTDPIIGTEAEVLMRVLPPGTRCPVLTRVWVTWVYCKKEKGYFCRDCVPQVDFFVSFFSCILSSDVRNRPWGAWVWLCCKQLYSHRAGLSFLMTWAVFCIHSFTNVWRKRIENFWTSPHNTSGLAERQKQQSFLVLFLWVVFTTQITASVRLCLIDICRWGAVLWQTPGLLWWVVMVVLTLVFTVWSLIQERVALTVHVVVDSVGLVHVTCASIFTGIQSICIAINHWKWDENKNSWCTGCRRKYAQKDQWGPTSRRIIRDKDGTQFDPVLCPRRRGWKIILFFFSTKVWR